MPGTSRPTERDPSILAFAAEHRLVLERQVERLLGVGPGNARRRLKQLVAGGYLTSDRVFSDRMFQIRPRGLTAIGSSLPAPRFNLGAYRHDVGLGWLWLMSHEGAFGPLHEVLSERRLRSHDGALDRAGEPYGVRLGGRDSRGNERLHYPDLLLIDRHGRRLALELELTPKGGGRREAILGGYGTDTGIDRVLYLVEEQPAGRAIKRTLEGTAHGMGVSDRVRFQLVRPLGSGVEGRGEAPQRALPSRRAAEATR